MSESETMSVSTANEQIDAMMAAHRAKTRQHLCRKLGVSKNMIRNWEIAGRVPQKYLRPVRKPVQVIAALAVLRDGKLSDTDARQAALAILQQMEAGHA